MEAYVQFVHYVDGGNRAARGTPQRELRTTQNTGEAFSEEKDMTQQLILLFVLSMPVACVAWTITHEEVFREAREWFSDKSKCAKHIYQRKFFYLFTCEYCFSHYAALFFLVLSGYKLIFDDWRGYLIAWFSLVWIANLYMSVFALLRLDIKRDRVEIAAVEKEHRVVEVQEPPRPGAG